MSMAISVGTVRYVSDGRCTDSLCGMAVRLTHGWTQTFGYTARIHKGGGVVLVGNEDSTPIII